MRFLILVEFAPQPRENASIHMGVSKNTGPSYSTLNSRILIIRTPKKKVPLIFGKSHMRLPVITQSLLDGF